MLEKISSDRQALQADKGLSTAAMVRKISSDTGGGGSAVMQPLTKQQMHCGKLQAAILASRKCLLSQKLSFSCTCTANHHKRPFL